MSPVAACRLLIILPLLCSIMHGTAVKPVWGDPGIVDAIVARVNGEAVLYSHLRRDMQMERMEPGFSFEGPLRSEDYRQLMTLRIDELLLMQDAEQKEIRGDNSEVARKVSGILKNLKSGFENTQYFHDYLEINGIRLETLRDILARQERLRALIERNIGRSIYMDRHEVESFLAQRGEKSLPIEEIEVAQVLIPCSQTLQATPMGKQLRSRAFEISRLLAGSHDTFSKMLRKVRHQDKMLHKPVYLGWMDPDDLLPELRAASVRMEPGETSVPVVTDRGYHVICLMNRRSAHDLLFAQKFRETRIRKLQQLREEADIRIYKPTDPTLSSLIPRALGAGRGAGEP